MENNLLLKVITPDGVIFNEYVEYVGIKSLNGEVTILKKHASIIGGIDNDIVKIKKQNNETIEYICGEGLFFIIDNVLKIVCSFFIFNNPKDIDMIIDKFNKNIELLTSENKVGNAESFKLEISIINQLKKMKYS